MAENILRPLHRGEAVEFRPPVWRLVARDGNCPAQQEHIAEWLREELPFLLRELPWEKATIIVAGTSQLDYDPETEIVVAPPAPS